mmetsp:Transcript_20696/g.57445  ORF Transcript_20696/g.57445 Transcript_20696/m.57445 type:complete len:389 (-) Transcript_20696:198-1364(-)
MYGPALNRFLLRVSAYDLHLDKGRRGDAFMSLIQPISSKVPYMTTPGNHERRQLFKQYKRRFLMPMGNPEDAWYSWDIGRVHFVSVASEPFVMASQSSDFAQLAKDQLLWLAKDLGQANRNRRKRPWVVVYGHRPLYCSNKGPGRDCNHNASKVRFALEKIFLIFGVDLYLCGHMHAYERSFPMALGNPIGIDETSKNNTRFNSTAADLMGRIDDSRSNGTNATLADPVVYAMDIAELLAPCKPMECEDSYNDVDDEGLSSNPSHLVEPGYRRHRIHGLKVREVLENPCSDMYLNPRGPVYITNGLAGVQKSGLWKLDTFGPQEPWSSIRFTDERLLGYGRLHVTNSSHLTWEQVRAEDGAVLDTITIVQEKHGSFMGHQTNHDDTDL